MQFILLQRSRAARCIPGNQLQGMQQNAILAQLACHPSVIIDIVERACVCRRWKFYYGIIMLKKKVFYSVKIFLCDPLSCMICVMRVFYWFFCIIFSFSFFNFKYYDELWNINIVSGFNSSIGACNCWGEKWSLVFLGESLL